METILTTSTLVPETPLPDVLRTVPEKNMASPWVPAFARDTPDGSSGASSV